MLRFVQAFMDALRMAWRVIVWRLGMMSTSYARRAKAYTDPFLTYVASDGCAVPLRTWLHARGLRDADIELDADTWHDMVEMLAAEAAAEAQDRPREDMN